MKLKMFTTALLALFIAVPLAAQEQQEVQIRLSEVELREIFANPTRSYVYVGKEVSDIAAIMDELSKFEEDQNSPVWGLKNHIERGFSIGNYDAVAQALEYSAAALDKHADAMGAEKVRELSGSLNNVIEQVIQERLNLDAEILSFLKDQVNLPEDATKSCGSCHNGLRLLTIKEKVEFLGKVKFKNDVTFSDDVKFKDDVKFEDEVLFEDDVTIEGALTVTDLVVLSCIDTLCVTNLSVLDVIVDNLSVIDINVSGTLSATDAFLGNAEIGCDLTVGCNISMNDSISPAIGNVIKNGNRFIHTYPGSASENTFVGENAGNFTMTGGNNTVVGNAALQNNIGGTLNTAVGTRALLNVDGSWNTAIGWEALRNSTTSFANTAIGTFSIQNGNPGNFNTAVGVSAMQNGNTGDFNTAVGAGAMFNASGTQNVAIGHDALNNNNGDFNIAIGVGAMFNAAGGDENVAIGHDALNSNTSDDIIGIGTRVLFSNTGINNTGVGFEALLSNTTGSSNTAFGFSALRLNTTGTLNTAVGQLSLPNNTIGIRNTAVGVNSMLLNTTGSNNTAVGVSAVQNNTIGIQNTGVGSATLSNNTTGSNNSTLGYFAMEQNLTGVQNVAVGSFAVRDNTTANDNTGLGYQTLLLNTTGAQNTAVGSQALLNVAGGQGNTAIGYIAGSSATTGNFNVYINNVGVAAESSTMRIGTAGVQTRNFQAGIRGVATGILDAIPVLIDSAGQLGTASSTRRVKHNINPMGDKSEAIYNLNPVTFVYNSDASETEQFGLIAEEVDQELSAIVVHNAEGLAETVQYQVLPVLLLNEMKKLAARVAALEARQN